MSSLPEETTIRRCSSAMTTSQLYFTSTRNEAQGSDLNGVTGIEIWRYLLSEKDDKGKWSKPEAIATGLNTDYDEGACCFTPRRQGRCISPNAPPTLASPRFAQIVTSSRSDAAWGKLQKLEISQGYLEYLRPPCHQS